MPNLQRVLSQPRSPPRDRISRQERRRQNYQKLIEKKRWAKEQKARARKSVPPSPPPLPVPSWPPSPPPPPPPPPPSPSSTSLASLGSDFVRGRSEPIKSANDDLTESFYRTEQIPQQPTIDECENVWQRQTRDDFFFVNCKRVLLPGSESQQSQDDEQQDPLSIEENTRNFLNTSRADDVINAFIKENDILDNVGTIRDPSEPATVPSSL